MHNTIKSEAVIDRLFSSGNKIKTRNLVVLFEQAAGSCGHNAFFAGKKLGSAPLRNRSKRRIRAAVAQTGSDCRHNIIYMARQNTARCQFGELLQDVAYAQRKIRKASDNNEL